MEIEITKNDIIAILEYSSNGTLAQDMIQNNLSVAAMGFFLDTIYRRCDEVLNEINKEENNENRKN